MGSCTSNRIWQPRLRPRSGRTYFRLNMLTGWSADLVQPQRQFDGKPLVLAAGAARAERSVFPGHHRRPELVFTSSARGINGIEVEGLLPGERGAVLAPLPIRHVTAAVPQLAVGHGDRRAPALVAPHRAAARLKIGATGADCPGADDGRLVVVLILDFGPVAIRRYAVRSVDRDVVLRRCSRCRCRTQNAEYVCGQQYRGGDRPS